MSEMIITAAFLVIGDEILSGRTKDKNIGYLADFLTGMGIDLKEVRIVSDDQTAIVAAVNQLRATYTHVFTSGGIGPTHDDITADAIAAAFAVGIDERDDALAMLRERYSAGELNDARRRMARIPDGGRLIPNRLTQAPGFSVENVHVMAGVPSIFQAMLDALAPDLTGGTLMQSREVSFSVPESLLADTLRQVQADYPDLLIGSYPSFDDNRFETRVVLRSRNESQLALGESALLSAFSALGRDEKTGMGG